VNAETVEIVESKDEGKEDYFTQLDKISPVTRIRQLRNNNPSRNDEILVTRLVTETSLNNGVINILLEYALLQKEGQLYDNYVSKLTRERQSKDKQRAEETKNVTRTLYKNQMKKKYNNYKVNRKTVKTKWFTESTKEKEHTEKRVTKKQSASIKDAIDRFRKL